jgi:alpha-D-ribose 1-methylphosphonate 5-triphosphate diphosphatase
MIITNAHIVTRDAVVHGSVMMEGGTVRSIDCTGSALPAAVDWEGDYLLPGLVELHTDNLEKHLLPRPGVFWPGLSAFLAHDAQLAAAGITTVLDAISLGDIEPNSARDRFMQSSLAALEEVREQGSARCEHWLHLRCELANANTMELYERFGADDLVRLVSVMDHTPGQRQWTRLDKFRQYTERLGSMTDAQFAELVSFRQEMQEKYSAINRAGIVQRARERGAILASHDDTTEDHVDEAVEAGISISEFPTTLDAARAARTGRMQTVMGAPNVVRGGSHSGNASALELAQAGLLDALSSDYVPASLLHAAFLLTREADFSLPQAVSTVSANPAAMVGLDDRGEIAIGKRADFIRVRLPKKAITATGPLEPNVAETWLLGKRVM